MYYTCCVCKRSRQDAILHHFPCTEKRLAIWLKCINRDNLKQLSPEQLSKLFVCQKHFEKKFVASKSRLVGKAYPTLFTKDEILNGVPSREDAENVDPQTDHTYCRKRHFDHTYSRLAPLSEMITSDSHVDQNLPGTSQYPSTTYRDLVYPVNTEATSSYPLDSQLNTVRGSNKDRTTVKRQKSSVKHLMKKLSNLNSASQIIYQEYQKAKKTISFYRRAKDALKFCKEKSFQKLTQNMNPYAKTLIKMQINLCNKTKKGRRFTTEEKLIALSIMKQSPKCYRFLHKIFILPSRSTLNKMVAKLNIETGICSQVFQLLEKEVTSWDEKRKMCSVIFDEMSLDTALTYDKNKDSINGFIELNKKENQFADHALVFMLRGAVFRWQQPVAFYFCQGATSGILLKTILKDVIIAVKKCGLKPVAIICDQGAAFQSALKSLKEETKRDQLLAHQIPDGTITINNVNLSIIYDPSHLIKGLRNNFLNKNIIFEGKISKWSDIVEVYETDCKHTETRLLHKLNDQYVIPEKIKKMKVLNCVKVLSKTVSAALLYTANFSHYADGRPVSQTLRNTAEIVMFFDQLFDSVNGAATLSKKNKGKILRTAVIAGSPHHSFWKDAISKLEKIKYIDSTGKEKTVPTLKNFIITLKSFMRLWQIWGIENLKIMRPRYFNSDPIENFFGQVRAYNYRSNNPNCYSFICTFKSLLITRVIKFHNKTFNCEDDPAEQVINLKLLFSNETDNVHPGHPKNRSVETIVEQARRERMNIHSRAYTAGWVVRRILNNLSLNKCKHCVNSLMTKEISNLHDWISHREYSVSKNSLNYPSESVIRCFGTIIEETNEYLENQAHENKISIKIKEKLIAKYSFEFINCTEHHDILVNQFIDLTVRFGIFNWCNIINKILKGTDIHRLKNCVLPDMQKKALEKFYKKMKNKSLNK